MSSALPPKPGEFESLRVLVIDDQEHVRRWIIRVLKGMGVTSVSEAEDGQAALARVVAPGAVFDFILCDLKMPNTDGIQLIRAFAALQLDTAVVLVSMEPERVLETSSLLAEEQGLRVVGALAKPVTEEKLGPLFRAAMPRGVAAAARPSRVSRDTMRDSLRDGALYLHYQPKIVMNTGRLAGVEALVRWKHPTVGLVGPDDFISLCEESPSLASWLLDHTLGEALAFASRWGETDDTLNVAVNVHAGAFDDLELPDRLETPACGSRDSGSPLTTLVPGTRDCRSSAACRSTNSRSTVSSCTARPIRARSGPWWKRVSRWRGTSR